ncbi:MAG: hypothetical protein RMK84_01345 [Oscillochloridaceae bacterium]|nr:hypothetical protein [Chloroflexaceae bacterium]MDW8388744.1 hypothetical protein [Oscillochloridaceae bacterium]
MTAAPTLPTDQQALAEEIYRLMVAQGAMFAFDTPIRQTLANLAAFLARRDGRDRAELEAAIDAALSADSRFTREVVNGEVRFVTTRKGAYVPRDETDTHSFKQRLHDPENPLPIDDISVVVSTSRPAITTVEPVYISDYWQMQLAAAPVESEAEAVAATAAPAPAAEPSVEEAPAVVAEAPAPVEEVAPEPAPAVVEIPAPAPVEEAAPQPAPAVLEMPAPAPVEEAAPQPAPAVLEMPAPRPAQPPRSTVFTLSDGTAIDLRRPVDEIMAEHGEALARVLAERLEHDPLQRIVSFGRKYYPEANLASFGKNDLRKIRDYILERNEPLLDTEIIADLYYHNPRQADYEGFRFSLNYRLHREKDFEFVGVEGAYLWATRGLAVTSGKRVKAAEMGQITAYLVEGYDDSLELQSIEAIRQSGSVTRLLTFFEWEYGVLPLDAGLAALLPPPLLPEQRSAVLRFESPQHFTSYLVEVRFSAGNRGGWLQGLEEFFHEHLVPGALITISRTGEPNLFHITYEEGPEQTERLLTFDEKKNRLAFANVSFYCVVDEDQLPAQSRYGRLNRLKAFPMGERRKAELMLEHVSETIGEQMGTPAEPRYAVTLDDLYVAFNVLRPASRAYLKALLERSEDFSADESTPGLYYYTPAPRASAEEVEEEEDEAPEERPSLRQRYSSRYDEDE